MLRSGLCRSSECPANNVRAKTSTMLSFTLSSRIKAVKGVDGEGDEEDCGPWGLGTIRVSGRGGCMVSRLTALRPGYLQPESLR
jgi:hypothetical protein